MKLSPRRTEPPWRNAVLVRDMRMRLRGPRAYWNQAFYLALLITIALAGYGTATNASRFIADPVQIQNSLSSFYFFIFTTLAGLIVLIAPALTAVSIVSEKQRMTLDLLVTTPMTSMQMLMGKLISSIAFLLLLLVISIPVSALCVILGGASIGDVFRTYALLAVDGVVLAAIGLTFSCSTKVGMQAIAATYASILGFGLLTFVAYEIMGSNVAGHMSGPAGVPAAPAAMALAVLNPFIAVYAPAASVSIAGLAVPVWLVAGVFAGLLVRALLTVAALRLGMYGVDLVSSLRRQTLMITSLSSFLVAQTLSTLTSNSSSSTSIQFLVAIAALPTIIAAVFFLPSLFVPVADEENALPTVESRPFSARCAFSSEHTGALPYFQLWLLCAMVSIVLGLVIPAGLSIGGGTALHTHAFVTARSFGSVLPAAVLTYVYYSAIGFLIWAIARRTASMTFSSTSARPMTFLIFVFVVIAPLLAIILMSQLGHVDGDITDNPVSWLWLFSPLAKPDAADTMASLLRFAWTIAYCYGLGILFYPPWRPVIVGDPRRDSDLLAPLP